MFKIFPFKWDLSTLFQPYEYNTLLDDRFNLLTSNIIPNNNFTIDGIKNLDNVEFEYYINKLVEINKKERQSDIEQTIKSSGGIIDE